MNPNLFQCPDCGNPCSTSAVSCPRCGRVMRPQQVQHPQTIVTRTKTSPVTWLVTGIIVFIVAVFGFIVVKDIFTKPASRTVLTKPSNP